MIAFLTVFTSDEIDRERKQVIVQTFALPSEPIGMAPFDNKWHTPPPDELTTTVTFTSTPWVSYVN